STGSAVWLRAVLFPASAACAPDRLPWLLYRPGPAAAASCPAASGKASVHRRERAPDRHPVPGADHWPPAATAAPSRLTTLLVRSVRPGVPGYLRRACDRGWRW